MSSIKSLQGYPLTQSDPDAPDPGQICDSEIFLQRKHGSFQKRIDSMRHKNRTLDLGEKFHLGNCDKEWFEITRNATDALFYLLGLLIYDLRTLGVQFYKK